MEEDAQAADSDSDETVIEGSVIESDQEDQAEHWRRLLFDQVTSCSAEFNFHSGTNGTWKGMPSPEIGLIFRKDSQDQKNKNKMVPSEDTTLQQPQEETTQNQVTLENRKTSPTLTDSFPQCGLPMINVNFGGPEAENTEILPCFQKELNEDKDSPEISLLSGTVLIGSSVVAVKEKSLTEPSSEPEKEESKDEDSSLETFVSTLEKFLSAESSKEQTLLEVMDDFDLGESTDPLNDSPSSILVPLRALSACCGDLLGSTKDGDSLPAEFLEAINTLSEAQTEDPEPFGLEILAYENVTSYEQLNNEGNSNPVKNTSVLKTPYILRRSSRLEKLKASKDTKHTDDMCKITKMILPKTFSCEDQIHKFSAENFRTQDSDLMTEDKEKNMHSSRTNSEWIRKNEQITTKNEKRMCRASINRRNHFGENLLYQAALRDDAKLVQRCIESGGNVNQPSYAGWTALHEASVGGFYWTVSELLKGGADVNFKGMHQITPLHDAVINGHHKVVELLLLNGADPLFRSDNGKCALDEAKDSCMKDLLEKYVTKHKNCLISARRKNTDPACGEDVHQFKKPKFSSNDHTGFVCDESSNRQEPEHIKINKGNKGLFTNEELYENCQEHSNNTKFVKSKNKQSTVNQMHSTGLRKGDLHSVKKRRTNVSKRKGKMNTRKHQKSQGDDGDGKLRQTVVVSSSRRMNRSGTGQQCTLQSLHDFPEESCELSTPTLSNLKNGFNNNDEACSVSKALHTHSMDLLDSQEMQSLELESIGQTGVVSLSGLSLHKANKSCRDGSTDKGTCLHKENKLAFVTTHYQPHIYQEECNTPYKSLENNNSDKKGKSLNKWENSFLTFIKHSDHDDGDCCTSEETVASETEINFMECANRCNHHRSIANRGEMDSQESLPSEDHLSQKNELKAGSLTTLPQQEVVNSCGLHSTVVSEQHVANYEQGIYRTPFNQSHGNPEHISLPCIRTPSIHEVSEVTSHVELLKTPQDNDPREQTPSVNQADVHNVEKKQDTEKNYTVTGQKPSSANSPSPRVVHCQGIGISRAGKKRQDLPENNFLSTDNMSKGLTNISQLNQREHKEISHESDEELTNSANGDYRTIKNYKKKKEKMDSEIHMPPNIQEHKKDPFDNQNSTEKQFQVSLDKFPEVNTAGINKKNARGESRLHLASRRGNLSLVKMLIESGADVNLKDNAGWTPLHEAASRGFNDIIVDLLKAGANVNFESIDGILPLHDAVANSHLKTVEILLEYGANPNKKDQKHKTALDEANDEKMKELLKSYGASETNNGDENNSAIPVKLPALRSKRNQQCTRDDGEAVVLPSLSRQTKRKVSLPGHQTISAILQDIEEKQEHLLEFEVASPEDAEEYIEKMLEIKEVMDDILVQQKAERDALAKKYRVSMESFKHGVLREQLADLATRQKRLLVVAKKQKKIKMKIQSYKSVTSFSGLSSSKLPAISHISSKKNKQEFTSLENSRYPQSGSFSPGNLACGSMKETPLSLETWNDSQNTNICLSEEAMRREECSGNVMNSKPNVSDCTLDGPLKSRHSDSTETIQVSSQPAAFAVQRELSQEENVPTETTARGHGISSPAAATTGSLSFSEGTHGLSQSDACPWTVTWDQDLFHGDLKRRNKRTDPQQPPGEVPKSLVHEGISVSGSDTVHQTDPCLKRTALATSHASNVHASSSSGSDHQRPIKKIIHYTTAPKKKSIQLKDLILLGRINPGSNLLEFKTKETTHKASILLSGKLKVENGQIYQNPVTWLKDLLGGDSYVTWNYAWSKVTYLGTELLKYVSEEAPLPPEPNVTPHQHEPCLPGTSRKSVQSFPHYLQIEEILLVSDQELLPRQVMDEHWRFYVECDELPF